VGNLYDFASNIFRPYSTIYQISSESPEFYRRYYTNMLVTFSGHTFIVTAVSKSI